MLRYLKGTVDYKMEFTQKSYFRLMRHILIKQTVFDSQKSTGRYCFSLGLALQQEASCSYIVFLPQMQSTEPQRKLFMMVYDGPGSLLELLREFYYNHLLQSKCSKDSRMSCIYYLMSRPHKGASTLHQVSNHD